MIKTNKLAKLTPLKKIPGAATDLIDPCSLLKTSTELLEHPPKLGIIYVVKYSKRNSIVQINKCVPIVRFKTNVRLIYDITKPIKLAYKSTIRLVITL